MAWGDDLSSSDGSAYILESKHSGDSSDRFDEGNPSSSAVPVPDVDAAAVDVYPTDCKDDEKYDITSSLEHVIVLGNYYRHQNWRVGEWKRAEDEKSRKLSLIDYAISESDAFDDDGDTSCVQQGPDFKRQRKNSKFERNTAQCIMHAQDARIYTPDNSFHSGLEPLPWPKRPGIAGKEVYTPDTKWVEELSDPLHPVSFSLMRLSSLVHMPTATITSVSPDDSVESRRPVDYDLDSDERSSDISSLEASRAMLLHCWERAVHAASSSICFDPLAMESNPQCSEATVPNNEPRPKRSRHDSLKMCEKLQIDYRIRKGPMNVDDQPPEPNNLQWQEDGNLVIECSSCSATFPSEGKLQDHFWGTTSTEGCCWKCIDLQRMETVAAVLSSEVRALVHQLLCLVMKDLSPVDNIESRSLTLLDGFDMWRLLENQLANSRKIADCRVDSFDDIYETIEVERFQPPLPINDAVLESVLVRLVDRYGRVPR